MPRKNSTIKADLIKVELPTVATWDKSEAVSAINALSNHLWDTLQPIVDKAVLVAAQYTAWKLSMAEVKDDAGKPVATGQAAYATATECDQNVIRAAVLIVTFNQAEFVAYKDSTKSYSFFGCVRSVEKARKAAKDLATAAKVESDHAAAVAEAIAKNETPPAAPVIASANGWKAETAAKRVAKDLDFQQLFALVGELNDILKGMMPKAA